MKEWLDFLLGRRVFALVLSLTFLLIALPIYGITWGVSCAAIGLFVMSLYMFEGIQNPSGWHMAVSAATGVISATPGFFAEVPSMDLDAAVWALCFFCVFPVILCVSAVRMRMDHLNKRMWRNATNVVI